MFGIFLPTQKWESDDEEFHYSLFDVKSSKKRLGENGNHLGVEVKIAARSKFCAMEIVNKLGSGLILRYASVESKIEAKFAKLKF